MASSNSKQMLLLAAVAAVACLASVASAKQWLVGDEGGWRVMFNETGWTDGKTFWIGDTLQFVYPPESHTVVQVGKDDFAACNLQGNQLRYWNSGNDVVQLDQPGKAWFICTNPNHCLNGMKLVVDVVDPWSSAPAPSPFFNFPIPWGSAPAPAPALPASPPSAAVRYPVGGALAAAAAVVVVAVLAF